MEQHFRPYEQRQNMLLPPNLEDFIEEKSLARIVDDVLNNVRMEVLEKPFEGGGRPPFHARMMLKVIIYAYCNKIYSCRKIALALNRDVAFMWLAAMEQPDFRTINRFRSEYFKEIIPEVFADVVKFLVSEGYIRSGDYFVDGTKLAADANKYSHVWKKNTQRYKELVLVRAKEILKEVEEINHKEDEELGDKHLPESGEDAQITSSKLQQVAEGINKALKEKNNQEEAKGLQKCARKLEKEAWKLANYEEQERLLGDRNSYSKTDPDATFMRMKNEELRAGYNVQVGTQDEFITGCSVHQNANDGTTFKTHLEERKELELPEAERVTADAGYGNEENYMELEKLEVEAYLKYPDFSRDLKDEHSEFHWTRFTQDESNKSFTCPAGRKLTFRETQEREQKSGFKYQVEVYECESCEGCPFKSACTKGSGNRQIHFNRRLDGYRRQAYKRLTSDEGRKLCLQRSNACESVFGDLKHNQGVTRFRLRGLPKVKLESMLHSICYNVRKLLRRMTPKMA